MHTLLNHRNLQNTKKGKFDLGSSVSYSWSDTDAFDSFFGKTRTGYVKGTVENWNSSFTKMQIKITDHSNAAVTIEGQQIYKGALIWVSPYGWN